MVSLLEWLRGAKETFNAVECHFKSSLYCFLKKENKSLAFMNEQGEAADTSHNQQYSRLADGWQF